MKSRMQRNWIQYKEQENMKYIRYFWYVLRHKWFVFIECCKLEILWLGVTHDSSKFQQSEFIPYARHFYGPNSHHKNGSHASKGIKTDRDKTGYYKAGDTGDLAFDFAWLLHQKRNKHHWQWWILPEDDGGIKVLSIPDNYLKEMVADWWGAGRAQGTPDTKKWYRKNKSKLQLETLTRDRVERMLAL